MSLEYLHLLALWMLRLLTPVPFDANEFALASRPYFERIAGRSVSSPYVYYGYGNGNGWTEVGPGGCLTVHGVHVNVRGKPYEAHTAAHEIAHGYQGAACLLMSWEREGKVWSGTFASRRWINLENSASLLALEVLAEMSRDHYPGAEYWFWAGVEKVTSVRPGWDAYTVTAYRTGPVRRLFESSGGTVTGSTPGPFVMDDAWILLQEANDQVMQRVK